MCWLLSARRKRYDGSNKCRAGGRGLNKKTFIASIPKRGGARILNTSLKDRLAGLIKKVAIKREMDLIKTGNGS